MSDTTPDAITTRPAEPGIDFDAVIIGAGFGGMYMLHALRRLGFSARVFEVGGDVGGTWYWNRYPGARCDIESLQYSYSFDDGLDQEWSWSERYAPQPEILDYARHVADRFDLRRDIRFNTRVRRASWNPVSSAWSIETDHGERVISRFCITAIGCLSTANHPRFPDMDVFRGEIFHTGEWPHDGVDFRDRRVVVIGTGSSAIQSIPVIASQARCLTVFQRTPNYSVPAWNQALDPEQERAVKANYPELRARMRARPTGFYFPFNTDSALDSSEAEREQQYETFWKRGGLPFLGAYGDLLFDKSANDTAAEFARRKIRAIVRDPATAALLCPDNVFGCKRLCVDTGYFETYNLPHVSLVDISRNPIERFTTGGVVTAGTEYPADIVVCATGFAAMTGSFERIAITGRDELPLTTKWQEGPRTFLGLATHGFPNMFMITGPGSPSVLASMIQAIEQHVDWIADCMAHMRDTGARIIEASLEAEDAWVDHVNEVAAISLRSTCSSWYTGANIPGRPLVFMPYIGGFPVYVQRCNQVMLDGYDGFVLDIHPAGNAAPRIRQTERWHVPLDIEVISPATIAARRVPIV